VRVLNFKFKNLFTLKVPTTLKRNLNTRKTIFINFLLLFTDRQLVCNLTTHWQRQKNGLQVNYYEQKNLARVLVTAKKNILIVLFPLSIFLPKNIWSNKSTVFMVHKVSWAIFRAYLGNLWRYDCNARLFHREFVMLSRTQLPYVHIFLSSDAELYYYNS